MYKSFYSPVEIAHESLLLFLAKMNYIEENELDFEIFKMLFIANVNKVVSNCQLFYIKSLCEEYILQRKKISTFYTF